jgi:hypothetical protein
MLLHLSSGAQLQCTAIGFYLWKTEVLVLSGVEVYFMWICVYFVFLIWCDIYVLVCFVKTIHEETTHQNHAIPKQIQ